MFDKQAQQIENTFESVLAIQNTFESVLLGHDSIFYFLEIANVGEAYLIFERISVLPKVCSTNRPNRLKTLLKVFWQFKTLF